MNMVRQFAAAALAAAAVAAGAERPNIILIMVDDLGFSDLGFMGGEIETPNLDALAAGGVRLSQFYNSGRCCPTRASLLTGLHPHQAGIGYMTQAVESRLDLERPPAYQGFLNRQCATTAELLRPAGYATMMTGKWHLGVHDRDGWPLQRGFEKFYGLLEGACRFFYSEHPRGITEGNERVATPASTTDEAFYTTDAFTDRAIQFLHEEFAGRRRPAFLYLAYNAPHWPLQAFERDIAKYRGRYRIGWDALRERRYRRQVELGLIDPSRPLSPRTPGIPAWETLDEARKDEMDLKMAVYAAMVDRVDQNIGKLVAFLRSAGADTNTMILFLSDNGACQEGGMFGRGEFRDPEKRNREGANSYGEAWANAGSTPFRLYKHFLHEGGSATPFFIHWPARIAPRPGWYNSPGQIIDILPTILEVAGAEYPAELHGHRLPPLEGVSLTPSLDGAPLRRTSPLVFEHEHNAAIRDGDWKQVGRNIAGRDGVDATRWELYNMAADRTETRNLAAEHPDKVRELAQAWSAWADRVGVYPKNGAGVAPRPEPDPPHVQGQAFTVAVIVKAERPRGVVLSHGGNTFGYALRFDKGTPVFEYRNRGKLARLAAHDPVSGTVTVAVHVATTQLTMRVNGAEAATSPSPGLLDEQPGLGLFVGASGPHAVGNYTPPDPFRGRIARHEILVELPQVAMRTPWGERLDPARVWTEYPRPAMRRDAWVNLNGYWDYAITPGDRAEPPAAWEGRILVPFAIEAPLSGVERRLRADEALWYRRAVSIRRAAGRRYLLNFEAVDYQTVVWVNDRKVGAHVGRNLPFSFDITDAVRDGENTILVRVTDATDARGAYQLHGKQRANPKGIWYTPVSGIWQTVWLQDVPDAHIANLWVEGSPDGVIRVAVQRSAAATDLEARVAASFEGRPVAEARGAAGDLALRVPNPVPWNPDRPALYDLRIELGNDAVHSYAGLRAVGRARDADGRWRFTLNGAPLFHWGTLDQGWWPDGLLTPSSDEAMVSDIEFLKAAGFNTIRKHIKVEPRRYYYHCDRLGMMVWQDHVSHRDPVGDPKWTRLQPDPEDPVWPVAAHRQFMAELQGMIETLRHHPCIVVWVPFNEAWGQHQTLKVGAWSVDFDPTRLVNIASGGNWFPVGHIVDHHQYPHPAFPFELGAGGRFDDYIKVVGEFGGHGFPVEGRLWSPRAANWGYGGLPKDKTEWLERYRTSVAMLADLKRQGIAAGIYTQTTDVEREINGLITYDRKVRKVPPETLREIHRQLEN